MSVLLFVYGTLKTGFIRAQFMREQRYLGTANTVAEYGMYAYGGYPALVDKKLAENSGVQADSSVYGEIYEVDDLCLVELDKVECVNEDLFSRQVISLENLSLTRLPLSKSVWDSIEKKQAQAYLFRRNLKGAANCGSFWAK